MPVHTISIYVASDAYDLAPEPRCCYHLGHSHIMQILWRKRPVVDCASLLVPIPIHIPTPSPLYYVPVELQRLRRHGEEVGESPDHRTPFSEARASTSIHVTDFVAQERGARRCREDESEEGYRRHEEGEG
jgi:hypothetical protein